MTTPANSFNRLAPAERKSVMLAAAIKLAEKPGGLSTLQCSKVAKSAGCSRTLVNHYFSDIEGLRVAVIKKSIQDENLGVISQAVIAGHRLARKINDALKHRAIAHATKA